MDRLLTAPPDAGSYEHVLYHPHIDTDQPQVLHFYNGAVTSRRVTFRGRPRHMLFVRTVAERDWLWRRGWVRCTEEWREHVRAAGGDGVLDDQVCRDALVLLVEADRPLQSGEVRAAIGLKDKAWRDTRNRLMAAGYVVVVGSGPDTRYRSTESGFESLTSGR